MVDRHPGPNPGGTEGPHCVQLVSIAGAQSVWWMEACSVSEEVFADVF